jgi:hypothetical protein
MDASASTLELGSWEGDRAVLTSALRGDRGDVEDLPDETRFQVHVSRMIRRRERHANAETSGAAGFIMVNAEEQRALSLERTFDRLIHTGSRRLSNRLHFVTALAHSSALEEHDGDDNDLFGRIAALGFDDRPAFIYVPSEDGSSLSYYPKGTRTDEVRYVELNFGQIAEEEVLATLEAIYRSELCTPDNMGPIKLWDKPEKWHPVEQAERTVQQMIRHALVGRFMWCTIRQEQAGKVGRTDLEIVDDRTGPAGTIYHHALLELKVLRSFGSTGIPYSQDAVNDAIIEGVNQANAYGVANNSLIRMLCCFDMRKDDPGDDATFVHVKDRAVTFSIRLKRWYLYRSSQDWRDALAEKQLVAASAPTSKE